MSSLSNIFMSLLVVVALASLETALAWTTGTNSVSWRLRPTATTALFANNNENSKNLPNFFDDEDCFDLCDDWDVGASPSPTDDNVESADTTASSNTSMSTTSFQNQQTKDHHKPSFQRMRLEMQWELRQNEEDCDLEVIETCGDFCADCVGVGSVQCRFCSGKGKLYLPPTNLYGGERVQPCPVCSQQGTEVCKTCRGSGRIAPWTSYSTS